MLKPAQPFPRTPFVLMNGHHILRFQKKNFSILDPSYGRRMGARAFQRGLFKEDAVAIDIECKKYPLLDVINLGKSFNLWSWFVRDQLIDIKYVFGEPVQLTFDEARHEIVELICSRKWYGRTAAAEKYFRETRAQARDMKEFLVGRYGIAFYGRWMMDYNPPKRRPPKKAART